MNSPQKAECCSERSLDLLPILPLLADAKSSNPLLLSNSLVETSICTKHQLHLDKTEGSMSSGVGVQGEIFIDTLQVIGQLVRLVDSLSLQVTAKVMAL